LSAAADEMAATQDRWQPTTLRISGGRVQTRDRGGPIAGGVARPLRARCGSKYRNLLRSSRRTTNIDAPTLIH